MEICLNVIFISLFIVLTASYPALVNDAQDEDSTGSDLVSDLSIEAQSDDVHKLEFTAVGQKYSFDLIPANSIFAPAFKITHMSESNGTIVDLTTESVDGKFYTDKNGIGSYYVENINGQVAVDGIVDDQLRISYEDGVQKIYRVNYNVPFSFDDDQLYPRLKHAKTYAETIVDQQTELPDTITVEVYAVVDSILYKSLKKTKTSVEKYLGLLWNAVQNKYKSIDHPTIKFAITGSTILPNKNWVKSSMIAFMGPLTVNGNMLVTNFGEWLYTEIGNPSIPNYDIAIMHTGLDLAKPTYGRYDKRQLGVAFNSALCEKSDEDKMVESVGLMEDRDPAMKFANVVVVAHEIGHLFGMQHDDEEVASKHCPEHYMMYSMVDKQTIETFSECSVNSLRAHLRLPESSCVMNPV